MGRGNAASDDGQTITRILPSRETAHQRLLCEYQPESDGNRVIEATADPIFMHLWNHIASNDEAGDEPEAALQSATMSIVELTSKLRQRRWATTH